MDNLNTYHNICKTKSPKITSNTFISSDDIKICKLKLNALKKNKTQQDNKKMSLEFLLYIKSLYIKYIERIQNDNNSNNLSNLSLIFIILEVSRNVVNNQIMVTLIEQAINKVYNGELWVEPFEDAKLRITYDN